MLSSLTANRKNLAGRAAKNINLLLEKERVEKEAIAHELSLTNDLIIAKIRFYYN